MPDFIRLSPNEEVQYLQDQERQFRQQRLLETRRQEWERARQGHRNYRQSLHRAVKNMKHDLELKWLNEHNDHIHALESALEESLFQLGKAQKDARQISDCQTRTAEQLQHRAMQELTTEKLRSSMALEALVGEHQRKLQEAKEHRARLQTTRGIENKRAANIAHMYRLCHPSDIPTGHVTIPAPDQQSRISQRVAMERSKRYDDSYHHHHSEYVAVRATPHSTQVPENVAARMAEIVMRRVDEAKKAKEAKLSEYETIARERYDKALNAAKMERDHNDMLHQLDVVQQADRRRRQLMVQSRQTLPSINDDINDSKVRAAMFEKIFGQRKREILHETKL